MRGRIRVIKTLPVKVMLRIQNSEPWNGKHQLVRDRPGPGCDWLLEGSGCGSRFKAVTSLFLTKGDSSFSTQGEEKYNKTNSEGIFLKTAQRKR